MKKSILNICTLVKSTLLVLSILVLAPSCRSTDTESISLSGPALVNVSIEGESYEEGEILGSASKSQKKMPTTRKLQTQRSLIPFNKDFDLVAELTPISSAKSARGNLHAKQLSSLEQGDVLDGIRYKLVVYTENGDYVTERDYVRGSESSTLALELIGGTKYTFIVYSLNSTTINSPVDFIDPNNKTLATSSIKNLNSSSFDLMYFRKDMMVSGNEPNYLGVVLKHMLSQVTTTIDANASNYNVIAVSGHFGPHSEFAIINLSDGTVLRSGSENNVEVQFPDLNAPIVESQPTILNSNAQNNGYLMLSSLTVGSLTRTNLMVSGLSFTPGVKYSLNISLVSNDSFIIHENQPAALINGRIWMRHNLGVDTSLNPDIVPTDHSWHGNMYQWGRGTVKATAWTGFEPQPGWDPTWILPANSWNSGTESNPMKTIEDPCPNGYRIPTATEFRALIEDTTPADMGYWYLDGWNWSAIKVLTSKRNSNVKLTFQANGNRTYDTGFLSARGGGGYYWTSTVEDNAAPYRYFIIRLNEVDVFDAIASWGFSIRCIAN